MNSSGPLKFFPQIGTSSYAAKKRLCFWPLLVVLLLIAGGWWIKGTLNSAVHEKIADELKAILQTDVTALKIWLESQATAANILASDQQIRSEILALIDESQESSNPWANILQSSSLNKLKKHLKALVEIRGFTGFVVFDSDMTVLASDHDEIIGKIPYQTSFFSSYRDRVFSGESIITHPFASEILLPFGDSFKAGQPSMLAAAPLKNDQGKIVAGLALRIPPQNDFTRILSAARPGESGETYAFNKTGVMISNSRFDEQLKKIGLIPNTDSSQSILNIQLRDPEVNLTRGKSTPIPLKERQLTKMAASAVSGHSGVDVIGYNDYRGVPVVGAWTWLEEYGFGVATELDYQEAYRPRYLLQRILWEMFGILLVVAICLLIASLTITRLRSSVQQAVLQAKQLGQYTLEKQLGAGGMGVVYQAKHQMLRRPTAVKIISPQENDDETISRFEREVQLTSQLTHPNTIAIYDYGRTPENVFYYAMEYLEGLTLQELVIKFGPQPEGRVIHLLQQICGSLAEAHDLGMIHRDIKPANIMLTHRGGIADVIKVLDFGLVKAIDSQHSGQLTSSNVITGTPLYLSPEAIQTPNQVDFKSDLYAVGAVGYYLITGEHIFEGESAVEICLQHLNEEPISPSERLGKAISVELETLILQCLSKKPQQRPQSARELASDLQLCQTDNSWNSRKAEFWWKEFPQHDSVNASTDQSSAFAETLVVVNPEFSGKQAT